MSYPSSGESVWFHWQMSRMKQQRCPELKKLLTVGESQVLKVTSTEGWWPPCLQHHRWNFTHVVFWRIHFHRVLVTWCSRYCFVLSCVLIVIAFTDGGPVPQYILVFQPQWTWILRPRRASLSNVFILKVNIWITSSVLICGEKVIIFIKCIFSAK